MTELSGFPYLEVEFGKRGKLVDGAQVDAVVREFGRLGVTDLIVWSHGWNNDMDEARDHYKRFATVMRAAADRHLAGRRVAILGVLWPSKKFAPEKLTAGGAASGEAGDKAVLIAQLDALKGAFTDRGADACLRKAKKLVPGLASPKIQAEFLELIRAAAVQPKAAKAGDDPEEGSDRGFTIEPKEAFQNLDRPIAPRRRASPGAGGAAVAAGSGGGARIAADSGGAAFNFGDIGRGVFAAAQRLLNFTTYFQMKERAGLVGRIGVHPVLQRLRRDLPAMRLHLVGHSFGARLVTAASSAAPSQAGATASTMTLLQGAFSHHGFAENYDAGKNGLFRPVVSPGRIGGPILVSHTDNDTAVGILYAIVSRLAGQQAAGVGDANDLYGGIGRNGAVKTPEAEFGTLGAIDTKYTFKPGKVYNLEAEQFIADHGDVHKPEVANALAQAIATTGP
ncbi:MAG: hypothetical protein ABIO99_01195 [Candidatus Limnocylindria bacterium]